jgi:hypothetical protein
MGRQAAALAVEPRNGDDDPLESLPRFVLPRFHTEGTARDRARYLVDHLHHVRGLRAGERHAREEFDADLGVVEVDRDRSERLSGTP